MEKSEITGRLEGGLERERKMIAQVSSMPTASKLRTWRGPFQTVRLDGEGPNTNIYEAFLSSFLKLQYHGPVSEYFFTISLQNT